MVFVWDLCLMIVIWVLLFACFAGLVVYLVFWLFVWDLKFKLRKW